MRSLPILVFATSLALVAGCSRTPSNGSTTSVDGKSPEAFLKWSMDKYAAMPSLTAQATVSTSTNGKPSEGKQHRDLFVDGSTRFKIVSKAPNGFSQTAVSDGKRLIEFASMGDSGAKSYPAPTHIGEANSLFMRHPMFCGSLLYQFMGGSSNFDKLVDASKGKVEFGGEEKAPGGEDAEIVKFFGQQSYGNVQALIGKQSGKIYRIRYDSATLLDRIKTIAQQQLAQLPAGKERDEFEKQMASQMPESFVTEEVYSDVSPGAKLTAATFDTTPPKGMKVSDAMDEANGKSPLPIGKPAPEFAVKNLRDGKTVSLSSLRGKVVMIDFWATWCGPCRKGLPETDKIAKDGAGKGLEVLAVSAEKAEEVAPFIKENGYTMPTYIDEGGRMMSAYKVDPIPCVVIIDAKGIVRSYLIGLYPPNEIRAQLAKAGAKI